MPCAIDLQALPTPKGAGRAVSAYEWSTPAAAISSSTSPASLPIGDDRQIDAQPTIAIDNLSLRNAAGRRLRKDRLLPQGQQVQIEPFGEFDLVYESDIDFASSTNVNRLVQHRLHSKTEPLSLDQVYATLEGKPSHRNGFTGR